MLWKMDGSYRKHNKRKKAEDGQAQNSCTQHRFPLPSHELCWLSAAWPIDWSFSSPLTVNCLAAAAKQSHAESTSRWQLQHPRPRAIGNWAASRTRPPLLTLSSTALSACLSEQLVHPARSHAGDFLSSLQTYLPNMLFNV